MAFGTINGQTQIDAQNIKGVLSIDQIPNLDASKVVSGVFNQWQIPNLDASKIQSGILPPAFGGTGVNSLEALKNILGIVSGITISEDFININKNITIYQDTCIGISLYMVKSNSNSQQSGSYYSGFIPFGALFLPYGYSGTINSVGYVGYVKENVSMVDFRASERNKNVVLGTSKNDYIDVVIFNKTT